MKIKKITGTIPAMVTPFDKDKNVDVAALKNLIKFLEF